MAEHPANTDSLRALSSKVQARAETQNRTLDEDIEIISNSNSASGVGFKSGRTIQDVVRVCRTLIRNRAQLTATTIKELPFAFTRTLESTLKENVKKYFPQDLGGFRVRVRNLARRAGGKKLEDVALDEIRTFQNEAIVGLLSEIDQYLVTLKHARHQSTFEKVLLFVEVACLVVAAFLFGLWVADKNGNYEPIIGMLFVVPAGLEVYRRVKGRKAT